jgi:hypothetical protein
VDVHQKDRRGIDTEEVADAVEELVEQVGGGQFRQGCVRHGKESAQPLIVPDPLGLRHA